MKKNVLALLLSSAVFLTACEDKNATAEIAKLKEEAFALKAELALNKERVPALEVEIVPFFNKAEEIKAKEGEVAGSVVRFISVAKTNVKWLDDVLFKNTYESLATTEDRPATLAEGKNAEAELLAFLNKDYDEALTAIKEAAAEFGGPMNADSFELETQYIGQRGKIASFSQFVNTYTGGAHGMYSTSYINVDTETKKIITLDDLIPKANQAQVKELLWQAYQDRSASDEGGEVNTFTSKADFDFSDNFLFTEEGIKFVYPPYALGAFAEGEVDLTLGWHQVNKLLNPSYQRTKKDGFELNPNNNDL